jgi:hypothetical protein
LPILQLSVCNKRFRFIDQRLGTKFTKRAYMTKHKNFRYNIRIMYNHKEAKCSEKKILDIIIKLNYRNFTFSSSLTLMPILHFWRNQHSLLTLTRNSHKVAQKVKNIVDHRVLEFRFASISRPGYCIHEILYFWSFKGKLFMCGFFSLYHTVSFLSFGVNTTCLRLWIVKQSDSHTVDRNKRFCLNEQLQDSRGEDCYK